MGKTDGATKTLKTVPDYTQQAHAPAPEGKKGKPQAAEKTGCLCDTCKAKVSRFGFCSEHYEQFKFGLIKKSGEPVPDYEKKFEHYQAYVKRTTGVQKVA